MPQICPKCHRANPTDALYCYEDGFSLGGRIGASGPVDPGAQPFPHPFVFPERRPLPQFRSTRARLLQRVGRRRRTDSQRRPCQFLCRTGSRRPGQGRPRGRAQEDKDRALDQVLGQLPAKTIEPAKLRVETLHVNMGQLTVGKDQRWELRLENQGMRLLSGTIACDDCVWLALGDGGGSPRKVFQFLTGTVIPVQVRGRLLASGREADGRPADHRDQRRRRHRRRHGRGSGQAVRRGRSGRGDHAATNRGESQGSRPRRRPRCSRTAPSRAGTSKTAGRTRCKGRPRPASEPCSNTSRRWA